MNKPPIAIFKPGEHTPMTGPRRGFTAATLAASAKAYDPKLHEAPLVIGHPAHNLPAYGWVQSLSFAEGMLSFEPRQVDPAFKEIVNAGRYKKRSASFYAPNSPENPVPGVYYLRHVGWLGAAAPGVKGLPDVSFAEGEDGIVTIDDLDFAEGEGAEAAFATAFRKFLGAFGLSFSEPSPTPPSELALPAPTPEPSPAPLPAPPVKETSTVPTPEELAAQAEALTKQQRELDERQARLDRAENASFVEGLITAGRVLPKDKDNLLSFMGGLSATVTLDFAEGDKAAKLPQLDFFKRLLQDQPKVVEFGERAPRVPHDPDVLSFAGPGGYHVSRDRAELDARAKAYMAKHPTVSYIDAAAAVEAQ